MSADALCAAAADPELWFSADLDDQQAAITICRVCPRRTECAQEATRHAYGIWGGVRALGAPGRKASDRRDRIVLACRQGHTPERIAADLGIRPGSLRTWCARHAPDLIRLLGRAAA